MKSIILGTVQGLTEFLPVSSSGHLLLLQRLLHYDLSGGSMTFVNVVLHVGTLIPVCVLLRRELFALFRSPKQLLFLLVATLPAALCGLLWHDEIDALFSGDKGLFLLALCFCFTAAELLLCRKARPRGEFGWKNALTMGAMQAVALFPGISRSGSTLAGGIWSGAEGERAAKFSFLMSIPVILGSLLVEGKAAAETVVLDGAAWAGILTGVACAALFGTIAIRFTLKAVQRGHYAGFAVYLFLLSALCLILQVSLV